ncbi:MAG: class I SAM-dependent methyltransferase, partial [Candidatus Dadabacteria bacterium]|nr:class I SAM-dependent methyltransferase [Candidatus Dadabacteria bacterium]
MSKDSGSFYTPQPLANWLASYVLERLPTRKSVNVLEPSCGNGVFLTALNKDKDGKTLYVNAVDIDKKSVKEARKGDYRFNLEVECGDFLQWQASKKYDLVIGNPPFVSRKRIRKQQIEVCKGIHKKIGFSREIANLWTAFVAKSILHLKK